MSTLSPNLDYAPAAPLRRRRRRRRIAILLALILLITAAIWFHKPIWRQTKILYYEHQCLNYTAPPDQIVYDEEDGLTSPLASAPGYLSTPAQPDKSTWSLPSKPATVAVRPATPLTDYATACGNPSACPGATVFMHELRTKSGTRRLVIITRVPKRTPPFYNDFGLDVTTLPLAGITSSPLTQKFPLVGSRIYDPFPEPPSTRHLRFYAGQLDPADPAHFTIKYDLLNQSGLIDGRLNQDGTTVNLNIISGPAKNAGWSADNGSPQH